MTLGFAPGIFHENFASRRFRPLFAVAVGLFIFSDEPAFLVIGECAGNDAGVLRFPRQRAD